MISCKIRTFEQARSLKQFFNFENTLYLLDKSNLIGNKKISFQKTDSKKYRQENCPLDKNFQWKLAHYLFHLSNWSYQKSPGGAL